MWVALYRNLNLGHAGAPTRVVLEQALLDAGARSARSFQTNGTVLLEADGAEAAAAVVRDAAPLLTQRSGYSDAVLMRSVDELAAVVAHAPFARGDDPRTYRETLTCLDVDEGDRLPFTLPWTDPADLLDLLHVEHGTVAGVVRRRGSAQGNPTAVVERATGRPATTRTLGTIERLLAAAGRPVREGGAQSATG